MKIEAAQAKLGSDATAAQKQAARRHWSSRSTRPQRRSDSSAKRSRRPTEAMAFRFDELRTASRGWSCGGEKLNQVAGPDAVELCPARAVSGADRVGLACRRCSARRHGRRDGRAVRRARLAAVRREPDRATALQLFGLYANGGTIGAGRWGIVGEKGAEVVAGPGDRRALGQGRGAAAAAAARTQVIQFNVTSPDAPSFARSEDADGGARVTRRGARAEERLMAGFNEVRFPTDVALGASGGPERRTDVVTLRSGGEERNAIWADARRKYQAGYGVKSFAQLEAVLAFFEAQRGRLYGFRWKDRFDYRSCASPNTPRPARPGDRHRRRGDGGVAADEDLCGRADALCAADPQAGGGNVTSRSTARSSRPARLCGRQRRPGW